MKKSENSKILPYTKNRSLPVILHPKPTIYVVIRYIKSWMRGLLD